MRCRRRSSFVSPSFSATITPSPSRGGSGWGWFSHRNATENHPLLTPLKGEEYNGGCGFESRRVHQIIFKTKMNGKQKRIYLKERRSAKRATVKRLYAPQLNAIPKGAVAANHGLLRHMNYSNVIAWYIDQPFTCRGCGIAELWKATDQKRYVESWGGHSDARAVRCRECRRKERGRVALARALSEEGVRLKLLRLQSTLKSADQ